MSTNDVNSVVATADATNVNANVQTAQVEQPAVVVEPLKVENIDVDVPIVRTPPKIVSNEPDEVQDEVIINSVNVNYSLPSINLLNTVKNVSNRDNEIKAKENIFELEKVLRDFDITGKIVQVNIGPTVTQYELEIKAGTKVSKLLSIQREIALALAAKDIRIQAEIAVEESDVIVFVVDGREDLTSNDLAIRDMLMKTNKKVIVACKRNENVISYFE